MNDKPVLKTFGYPADKLSAPSTSPVAERKRKAEARARLARIAYEKNWGARTFQEHLLVESNPKQTGFLISPAFASQLIPKYDWEKCVFAFVNLAMGTVEFVGWLYHYEINQYKYPRFDGHKVDRSWFRSMDTYTP